MTHQIDRRTFLVVGAGAFAWVACGRDGETPAASTPSARELSVVQVSTEVAPGDKRFAFAFFTSDRKPFDPQADTVPVRLTGPGDPPGELNAQAEDISQYLASERFGAETHRIFALRYTFTSPGVYALSTEVDGLEGSLSFQVVETSETVPVGGKAISVPTPTTSDPRGVDPICTRDPQCSMHDVSLDTALASGKPVVVTFATPKYCTSRTCGPVVDIVQSAKEALGDAAAFVHVEVWKDEASVGQAPSPGFAAWKLGTEPWLFFIGADGIVRDRWSGAMGPDATRARVQELIDGKL